MKYFFVTLMLSLFLLLPIAAEAAAPVEVDVLYMNHGPLQPTLEKLKTIFTRYGKAITPRWHDFESQEGKNFMATKGLRQHVPLMIWINGKETVQVDGASCSFSGFPSGSGPEFFQGKWTLESLAKALDQATGKH